MFNMLSQPIFVPYKSVDYAQQITKQILENMLITHALYESIRCLRKHSERIPYE